MSAKNLLFLSESDIKSAISMREIIDLMRIAFRQISEEIVSIPLRTKLDISKYDAGALFMPAHSAESNLISLKVVTEYKNNPKYKLPLIQALVLLLDGENGKPLAVMDAEYLTALRTGAASGLATELLARPNADTLGIIGAGVQSRTQLSAVSEVRTLKKLIIIDKNPDAAKSLAEYAKNDLQLNVEVAYPTTQLSECDIICTATTSPVPVFTDSDLKTGVHINAVGAYQPDKREIPGDTIKRSKVIVDQRSACLEEAGDLIIPINEKLIKPDHIYAELGEIVIGKKPGRSDEYEITVFKSVGIAAQDLIAAGTIYKKAREAGLGASISL